MLLRCKVCQATQPVLAADEADEDVRTQAIRRAFRAEHAASCGAGSVALALSPSAGGPVVVDGLFEWAAPIDRPDDVTPTQDGYFTRLIVRDGVQHQVRVCEGCWQNMPRYVDFPFGLVSPDSDAKTRRIHMDTAAPSVGVEHLPTAVCLPCYLAAFHRTYPTAALPTLRDDVVGDGTSAAAPAPSSAPIAIGDPSQAVGV